VTWMISIPHKRRDEPLSATAGFARHLRPGDDREVARQIVFGAMERGVRTAGDLLDHIAALDPHERRVMLDTARQAACLPGIEEVERRERLNAPLTVPPAPATPTMELRRRADGSFYEVPIAAPRYGIGASGQLVDLNAQARDADRAVEAAEALASRQAADAAGQRELPPHLRDRA